MCLTYICELAATKYTVYVRDVDFTVQQKLTVTCTKVLLSGVKN